MITRAARALRRRLRFWREAARLADYYQHLVGVPVR